MTKKRKVAPWPAAAERICKELQEENATLLAALKELVAVIHDSDQRKHSSSMRLLSIVSGKPEYAALDAARAAIVKAEAQA